MNRRYLGAMLAFLNAAALAQQPPKPAASAPPRLLELPVLLQEKIVAGKTPVGAPVHAKLWIATLVHGVVVPKNAVLSGHVEESVARSESSPSRLKIHLDLAQWKGGSVPLHAFLSNKVHRLLAMRDIHDSAAGDFGDTAVLHGGMKGSPGIASETERQAQAGLHPRDPMSQQDSTTPHARIDEYQQSVPNLDEIRGADGSREIISTRKNIKLGRSLIYVFEGAQ